MPEEFAGMLRSYQRVIALWPASTKFFYPNGTPTPRGEIFREPTLANTFRELAAAEKKTRGNRSKKLRAVRDLFYKGAIAKQIADYCAKNGGLIAYSDLANFHADAEDPKTGTYRGYEIYKPGFWTQGPVMIEALNLLEGFDLKAMGHNSPQYLHTVVEAVKLAFADRDHYYGDPKFSKIPEEILLSKDYAAERRKLIDPEHASMEHRPGSFGTRISLPSTSATNDAGERHHLRQRGGPPGQCIFSHAQRRLAAVGDHGRHRHSAHQPIAVVRDDARTSQSVAARQAPARDAESDAGHARPGSWS